MCKQTINTRTSEVYRRFMCARMYCVLERLVSMVTVNEVLVSTSAKPGHEATSYAHMHMHMRYAAKACDCNYPCCILVCCEPVSGYERWLVRVVWRALPACCWRSPSAHLRLLTPPSTLKSKGMSAIFTANASDGVYIAIANAALVTSLRPFYFAASFHETFCLSKQLYFVAVKFWMLFMISAVFSRHFSCNIQPC